MKNYKAETSFNFDKIVKLIELYLDLIHLEWNDTTNIKLFIPAININIIIK